MSVSDIKLKVLDTATIQIADQSAYYEEHSGPELMRRWESAVEAAIGSLRKLPERGELLMIDTIGLRLLRKLHIKKFPKHLILYRFDSASHTVLIVSVLHGARDIGALLMVSNLT